MKILLLAPHPFYQERGTPIAVNLIVKALSERGDKVDILTFHEGTNKHYKNLNIYRISPPVWTNSIRPGFSLKKLVCDIYMFFKFCSLFFKKRYDLVHAVEEGAFMAMLICPLRSTPFIFDIDSSMTTQLVDKYRFLRPFGFILHFLESLPMRFAIATIPVCDSLAEVVSRYRNENVLVLKDVSLISKGEGLNEVEDIKNTYNLKNKIVMYIGNLESYQGIDLLLESYKLVMDKYQDASLVIIGGIENDIKYYMQHCKLLGIDKNVHFLGQRPVDHINGYMKQADILVSPRTKGVNTPMKIYSYLDSGVAVLATDLPTHTQAMNGDIAKLASPNDRDFSKAMLELFEDDALRIELARKARAYIEKEHSYPVFQKKLHDLYSKLEESIRH